MRQGAKAHCSAPPRIDDPSTVWSTWVQSVEWIDPIREQRFRDEVRDLLWPVLGLRRGGVAVDVGCGGGAVTRALARWMGPGSKVVGTDRDVNFLHYARRRAKEERLGRRLRYLQGDALDLPLPDNFADAMTSYTVLGHISDTKRFLTEKMRVCRPGGRVSVLEVRGKAGLASSPRRSGRPSAREQELWRPLEKVWRKSVDEPWRVASAEVGLAELPDLFEQLGLVEVMLESFSSVNTLEDARITPGEALRHLSAQERWLLAQVDRSAALLKRPLPPRHLSSLRRCIKTRYEKLRRWVRDGVHTWDFSVSLSLAVSGRKP